MVEIKSPSIDITLNIYDVVALIRSHYSAKHGAAVEGVTVLSWNTPVLRVVGDTLVEPVRHHLRQDHSHG